MSKEKIVKIIRDSHRVTKKLGIPHWFLGGIATTTYVHGKIIREYGKDRGWLMRPKIKSDRCQYV